MEELFACLSCRWDNCTLPVAKTSLAWHLGVLSVLGARLGLPHTGRKIKNYLTEVSRAVVHDAVQVAH